MRPKLCPICKKYLNEDDLEYWCSYCNYESIKNITPDWSWADD